MAFISLLNTYFFGPILPVFVLVCSCVIGARIGFFYIFKPRLVLATLKSEGDGENSPVRALTVALAGTLGVGNIVGVASAISLGGAGVVFWFWVSAVLAMALKYSEVVLALKHRRVICEKDKDGVCHRHCFGGAFVYMNSCGHKYTALFFAALCVVTSISMGSLVQSNALGNSLDLLIGHKVIIAAVTCVFVYLTVRGGFSQVSGVTYVGIPFFCLLFCVLSIYVIVVERERLWGILCEIVSSAFDFKTAGVGLLSSSFMMSLRYGVARGILSNEAGSGTSPTAHAQSDCESPAKQGLLGVFEVFADTVVLCSMTAFVILLSGVDIHTPDAIELTVAAFAKYFGAFAKPYICITLCFFAFATVICWSLYGSEAIRYVLFEHTRGVSFTAVNRVYLLIYAFSTALGALMPQGIMWDISDLSVALMTMVNSVFLLFNCRDVVFETKEYIKSKAR